jgi:hypothetical protein
MANSVEHGIQAVGFFLTVLAAIVFLSGPCDGADAPELVKNGMFTTGSAGEPLGWGHAAYFSTDDAVNFEWIPSPSGAGALRISNFIANDSRWVQSASVLPSHWYHVSGWIRTENAGTQVPGGYLVEMQSNAESADLRGTHDWQLVEFWFRTDKAQKVAYLACRIGGYSALNTGTAYFAAISMTPVGGFPEGADYVYGASVFDFFSLRVIIFASAMILLASAILLWRFVMGDLSSGAGTG